MYVSWKSAIYEDKHTIHSVHLGHFVCPTHLGRITTWTDHSSFASKYLYILLLMHVVYILPQYVLSAKGYTLGKKAPLPACTPMIILTLLLSRNLAHKKRSNPSGWPHVWRRPSLQNSGLLVKSSTIATYLYHYFFVIVSTKRPIALFRFQALVALMAMPFLFAGKLFTYGETPPPPPPRWRLGGWNF